MQKNILIEKWAKELSIKLGRSESDIVSRGLSAFDFSPSRSVEIFYSPGSVVKFSFAFMVLNEESRSVAIFTEHHGYHEFSLYGALAKEIDVNIFVDEGYEGEVT